MTRAPLLLVALLPACAEVVVEFPALPGEGGPGVDTAADTAGPDDSACETRFWRDADGDGYGDEEDEVLGCEAPVGYAAAAGDCDDADGARHPGAEETCDELDQDCDGDVDEDAVDATPWYADADGDGWGDEGQATMACAAGPSQVAAAGDCDDGDGDVSPSAEDAAYDGVDDDCDGRADTMAVGDVSGWTVVGERGGDAVGSGAVLPIASLVEGVPGGLLVASPSLQTADAGGLGLHAVDARGTGLGAEAGWLDLGGGNGDKLGAAIALLDDATGDSVPELAVGAPGVDAASSRGSAATNAGAVWLLEAKTLAVGGADVEDVGGVLLAGDMSSGAFGSALATGDLDADGLPDLLVGAPGESNTKGRVYGVFDVGALWASDVAAGYGMEVAGVSVDDALGTALAVGDVDADGYPDLLACAPGNDLGGAEAGGCWLVSGATAGTLGERAIADVATASFVGAAAGDGLGPAGGVGVADVDGDGRGDVVVGVPGYDGAVAEGGAVAIWRGGALAGALTLAAADWLVEGDGALGTAVALPGDLDGDAVADLLLGAPTAGTTGTVYAVAGLADGVGALPGGELGSWAGESAGDTFGSRLGVGPDLDGDGRAEIAATAPANAEAGAGAGKVYVFGGYR